jgi:hypothetical protein
MQLLKNHHNRDRLHRLHWFGQVQGMEENRIPKRVLYVNLEISDQEIGGKMK